MTTRINEVKKLVKHFSDNCKYKFNSTAWNSNHKWNNDKGQCEYKMNRVCKNITVGILADVFVRTLCM